MKAILEQLDAFGAPTRTVVTVASPRPVTRAPQKRLAVTTLEAGRAKGADGKRADSLRCLHDIKAAGAFGRTRNELAERLTLPIQSVCWAVDALLHPKGDTPAEVCEPIVEHAPKPRHLTRERSKVLVAVLYRDKYERPVQGITARLAGGS